MPSSVPSDLLGPALWLVSSFVLTLALTRLTLQWLRAKAVLDLPNERSSHSVPTPRGGGLAVTPVVVAGWALAGWVAPAPPAFWAAFWAALGGSVLLAGLSFLDDRLSLSRRLRLALHVGAVALATAMLPDTLLVFQGWMPLWLDRTVTLIGWVWFVNLYNFMDGIDGITGVETASIGGGLVLVGVLVPVASGLPFPLLGLVLIGASLGFLVFNWHPASLFMGDVGSIPLGYLLGFVLIVLAGEGHLAAALILPAYYVLDATVTLLKRLVQGKPVGQAHREHFYQYAVHHGKRSHAEVALLVLGGNLCLTVAAAAALTGATGLAVGLCLGTLLLLMVLFRRAPR